jgi:hypothetical protein
VPSEMFGDETLVLAAFLIIDVTQRLPAVIAHNETGAVIFDVPRWREATRILGHERDLCADCLGDQMRDARFYDAL